MVRMLVVLCASCVAAHCRAATVASTVIASVFTHLRRMGRLWYNTRHERATFQSIARNARRMRVVRLNGILPPLRGGAVNTQQMTAQKKMRRRGIGRMARAGRARGRVLTRSLSSNIPAGGGGGGEFYQFQKPYSGLLAHSQTRGRKGQQCFVRCVPFCPLTSNSKQATSNNEKTDMESCRLGSGNLRSNGGIWSSREGGQPRFSVQRSGIVPDREQVREGEVQVQHLSRPLDTQRKHLLEG